MNQVDLNALPAQLHEIGLGRVRHAVEHLLSGRDQTLPRLQKAETLRLPGVAGPLKGRIYSPLEAISSSPVVLYFHGGGFVLGSPQTHEALCVRLAAASGLRVVSSAYRLAPEAPFPAQLEDALAVTDWVRSNVQGAQRLILAGDSAGAWLAATVAARVNAQNPGAVIAQALIYPLVDMDDEAWAETLFRDGRIVGRLAVAYIRAALTCDAPTLIDAIGPHTPSTLLLVGGPLDPVRPDVERYFEALAANGVKTIIRRHNALPHGFGNLTHVSAEARDAIADAGQRLKALVA